MGGIGFSDFASGLSGGMNAGMNQLAQGFDALTQQKLQQQQHQQQIADQIAAEGRAHEWDLKMAADRDATEQQKLDAEMASKGFRRTPNGDQAAAQRIVEAPSQVRNNPMASFLDSMSPMMIPGPLPAALGAGSADPTSSGWLKTAQTGAAIADPRNAGVVQRVGGANQVADPNNPNAWENLRNIAWKGGGDTWEPDMAFMALHQPKGGHQAGAFEWAMKYDEAARAAIANEQPPGQLAQLLAASEAARAGGVSLPAAQQATLDKMNANWETDKEQRRQHNFRTFITRDATAGIPEAVDLASRYGFIDPTKTINPGVHGNAAAVGVPPPAQGQGFNMEAEADGPGPVGGAPVGAPDDQLAGAESELVQRLAAIQQGKGGGGGAPVATPGPPSMYPVDLMTKMAFSPQGPGLPDVRGLASAAGSAPVRAPLPPALTNPNVIGTDKPGQQNFGGFTPNNHLVSDVQPIVDFLHAHAGKKPGRVSTPQMVAPPPAGPPMVGAGPAGVAPALPSPGAPGGDPTKFPWQDQLASQWSAALGSTIPAPGSPGAAPYDRHILGLGLSPAEAKAAGITVGPDGSFQMDPIRPQPGLMDRALTSLHGIFGNGTAVAQPQPGQDQPPQVQPGPTQMQQAPLLQGRPFTPPAEAGQLLGARSAAQAEAEAEIKKGLYKRPEKAKHHPGAQQTQWGTDIGYWPWK